MSQPIFGSAERMLNDVNLAKGKEGVGDSLSVHLAQTPGSAAIWTIQVFVHIDQGTYFLGSIVTTPPSAGNVPSRTVLIATCPAATDWKVVATCPTDGEEAYLDLDSSKCCTSAIGVRKLDFTAGGADQDVNIVGPAVLDVNVVSALDDTPWLNTFSTALASSFSILPSPGVLRSITARIDGSAPSATYYLQVWDSAALPADGAAVTLANSLIAPVKQVHVATLDDLILIDFNEKGVAFDFGAHINLSSTQFTKTLSGVYLVVLSAEYRLP